MLLHVLLLLLVQFVDHITNQNIAFQYRDLYEGDRCELPNKRSGVCRKANECRSAANDSLILCAGRAIICCDVIRQQCEDAKLIKNNSFTDHLVGNTVAADVGEFPFMALVEYDHENFRCGASIISRRFLLTAAHCFSNEATMLRVRLGTVDATDRDAASVEIARFHSHPRFRRRQNDIGLIELKSDIKMTENIKPICLYTALEDIPESTNLTVMGWGKINEDDTSKVLLKGTIQPVLRSTCQTRFGSQLQLSDNQMCALGEQDKKGYATDACQGDSGGPLVMKQNGVFQLVGVVSTGAGCGSELHAGVYTRVSRYLDWIVEVGVWNRTLG